jgi:acyl carrier protein
VLMAFSKEDTLKKVVAIIAEKLSMSSDLIKSTATFKDLGADSLDIVEIIMNFEETFGIEIKDEDAEKIKTVGEAVELIHNVRTK